MELKNIIVQDTIICQNKDIPSVNLDGEVGMMNINKGAYYCTDEVGTKIWEEIVTPTCANDVVDKLLNEYSIDKEICLEQVLDFLNDLFNHELIIIH